MLSSNPMMLHQLQYNQWCYQDRYQLLHEENTFLKTIYQTFDIHNATWLFQATQPTSTQPSSGEGGFASTHCDLSYVFAFIYILMYFFQSIYIVM